MRLVVVDVMNSQSVAQVGFGDAAKLTGVQVAGSDSCLQGEREAWRVLGGGHAAEPARIHLPAKPLRRSHLNLWPGHALTHLLSLGCAALGRPVRLHRGAVLRTLPTDQVGIASPLLRSRHPGACLRGADVFCSARLLSLVTGRASLDPSIDDGLTIDALPYLSHRSIVP